MSSPVHASSLRPDQQPNQQSTPRQQEETTYVRSFLRRAWDKVESILVPNRESSPPYYAEESPLPLYDSDVDLDDDADEDDDIADDVSSYHLSDHYQLHPYHMLGGHRRRKSTASQELIRPSRRSTRRYESWTADFDTARQRDDKSPAKDLIAGWAMGEVGPWFD